MVRRSPQVGCSIVTIFRVGPRLGPVDCHFEAERRASPGGCSSFRAVYLDFQVLVAVSRVPRSSCQSAAHEQTATSGRVAIDMPCV